LSDIEVAHLDETEEEIALYRSFPRWYGYVFYILRKND